MNIVWRHPLAVMASAVGVVVLVVAIVLLGLDGGGSSDVPRATPTATPTTSSSPVPGDADPTEATSGAGTGSGSAGSSSSFGQELTGLQGEGATASIPTHRVTMSAQSDQSILVLGYLVPTSKDASYGRVREPGRSWSRSTTVYGPPDYAQIFLQSGPNATTISCTVTVDGRVTEQRTATGPYAQLFCQG